MSDLCLGGRISGIMGYFRWIMFGLLIVVIIEGIFFVAVPGSVRDFCNQHPMFDAHGQLKKASDAKIRITGIFMIILSAAMLILLLVG